MAVILGFPTSLDVWRNGTRFAVILEQWRGGDGRYAGLGALSWLPASLEAAVVPADAPLELVAPRPDGGAAVKPSKEERASVRETLEGLGLVAAGARVTLVTTQPGARLRNGGFASLVWSRPILEGWVVPLVVNGLRVPGVFVSAPAFSFVQAAAAGASLGELASLACELSGRYRLQTRASRDRLATVAPRPVCREHQPRPLLSLERLRREVGLEQFDRVRGIERARRAAEWALPDGASTLEAMTGVLARMPRSAGGAGLPAPVLNEYFALDPRAAATVGVDGYHLDLAFHVLSLGMLLPPRAEIEVFGRDGHGGGSFKEVTDDARRRDAITRSGCLCLTLTHEQVMSYRDFDAAMEQVASAIGIERYPRSPVRHDRRAQFIGQWNRERFLSETPWLEG